MSKQETLGKRIKRLRTGLKMSVAQLSYKAKVSTPNLYYYENDERVPMIPEKLADIADALSVSTDYLIRGEKNQKEEEKS